MHVSSESVLLNAPARTDTIPISPSHQQQSIMGASDKVVGLVLLLISVVVYVYYTVWVLLTPFIDEDHEIQRFFLPYHYAITIPAVLLVLLFSGAATFIGLVMLRSKSPKKKAD